jgi:1,4-alpha-glucan branching enzyme
VKIGDKDLYEYNIEKDDVASFYLANLAFFLSTFQIDGFHFKHIDSFSRTEKGQVMLKCMNIMNQRLHENGFTLASCRK